LSYIREEAQEGFSPETSVAGLEPLLAVERRP